MQRGIIRQVNENFSDMMGNQTDSILNKSFFDFIAPEGLLEVEKYYLNRLKGANTSCYETILLIEDRKISVEVSINPTNLNGEKAEIMIFKEMKTKKNKK
jgi:PAS domain S-box-containing protein